MSPEELVEEVAVAFRAAANPVLAEQMSARLEGRFTYYGLLRPARDRAIAHILTRVPDRPHNFWLLNLLELCWMRREREMQYFANDFLTGHIHLLEEPFPDVARRVVMVKPWWDTVDPFAVRILGPWIRRSNRQDVADKWVRTSQRWMVRSALLHQLSFGQATDEKRLFDYCLQHGRSEDHMVRKAVAWSLVTYRESCPQSVERFLRRNPNAFAPDINVDLAQDLTKDQAISRAR